MSRDWINIRFGARHWHIGPWYITTEINPYHIHTKPAKWFEVYL